MEKEELRELVKEYDAGIAWLKHAFTYGFENSVNRVGFLLELKGHGVNDLDYGDNSRFEELQELGEKLELEKIRHNHKFFLKWLKKED